MAAIDVNTERRVLQSLIGRAFESFRGPRQFLDDCLECALPTSDKITANMSLSKMQKALLNVALDFDLIQFFDELIRDANAESLNEPFIKRFSSWATDRIADSDKKIDDILQSLFDSDSAQQLDSKSLKTLHGAKCDLQVLSISLDALLDTIGESEDSHKDAIAESIERSQLLVIKIQIAMSLYHSAIIPLKESTSESVNMSSFLQNMDLTYAVQREKLKNSTTDDSLLIDLIIEQIHQSNQEEGEEAPIVPVWERNQNGSFYPPPSVKAVLDLYDKPDKEITQILKHCLFLYFLHDLIKAIEMSAPQLKTKIAGLKQLPKTMLLPIALERFINGMRCIDTGRFSEVIPQMTDDRVTEIFKEDSFNFGENLLTLIKKKAIHLLISFNQPAIALQLFESLAAADSLIPNKDALYICLLLQNRRLYEAFLYQRSARLSSSLVDNPDLLISFFENCDEQGLLKKIFMLPLDALESQLLVNYLIVRSPKNGKHLALLYYVVNNRFLDAEIFLNEYGRDLQETTDAALRRETNELIGLIRSSLANVPHVLDEANELLVNKTSKNDSILSAITSAKKSRKQFGSDFDRMSSPALSETPSLLAGTSASRFRQTETPVRRLEQIQEEGTHRPSTPKKDQDEDGQNYLKASDVKVRVRNRSETPKSKGKRGGRSSRSATPASETDSTSTFSMSLRSRK